MSKGRKKDLRSPIKRGSKHIVIFDEPIRLPAAQPKLTREADDEVGQHGRGDANAQNPRIRGTMGVLTLAKPTVG